MLGLGEHRLRGGEPGAIREGVEREQFLRIVERVGEGVDEKPRAFGDEVAVQLLALTHVPGIELTPGERLLGDPGGGYRRRSADERAQYAGHCGDEIRVHGYSAGRPSTKPSLALVSKCPPTYPSAWRNACCGFRASLCRP